MQKELSTKHIKKYDDAAKVIADIFGTSDSYVRRVMADSTHIKYKSELAMAIRKAYLQYKHQKTKLIQLISTYKPTNTANTAA